MDDKAGRFIKADSEEHLQSLASKRFGEAEASERMKTRNGVFTVGDFVTVRGSLFVVEAIDETLLILRLKKR